jgi:inward rectifier potassium channel
MAIDTTTKDAPAQQAAPPSARPLPTQLPYARIVASGRKVPPRPIIAGQDRSRWTDIYQGMLRAPWWAFIIGLGVVFFLIVSVFAGLYMLNPGGISNLNVDNFWEVFFFSAATLTTSGTGNLGPTDLYSNIVVTLEGFFGVLNIAVATGALFARISRPTSRMLFSKIATITVFEGQPTFMFRVANQRGNQVLEAECTLTLARQITTREGYTMRRFEELPLVRARTPLFALSWTIMHMIDEKSPLYGATQDMMFEQQMEIIAVVSGTDETYSDTIYARDSYTPDEIVWNKRFVDILSVHKGRRRVDLNHFHDVCDEECLIRTEGVVNEADGEHA